MQVMLDNEQWTVNDNTSLMEILAQVSDKAFAQNRVVIALQVGERRMTDRDLTPTQLGRIGAGMGPVRATTQSMTQIIDGGDASMRLFAGLLKSDALGIVQAIRAGQPPAGPFLMPGWAGSPITWNVRKPRCRKQHLAFPCHLWLLGWPVYWKFG